MYGYQIITVGSGAAVSNWIDMRDYGLGGLVTPATLDANSHVAFMVTNDPVNNPGGFPLYKVGINLTQ